MKFNSFYTNRPKPIGFMPDTETKFVDQSEADRCSIQYNLERFGMSGIASMFEKTKAQFGYADTRVSKNFGELSQKVAEANEYFMQMPAEIRKKFNHNAVDFYTAIEKEPEKMFNDGYISKDLAIKLGVNFPEHVQHVETVKVDDFGPVSDVKTSEVQTSVNNVNE